MNGNDCDDKCGCENDSSRPPPYEPAISAINGLLSPALLHPPSSRSERDYGGQDGGEGEDSAHYVQEECSWSAADKNVRAPVVPQRGAEHYLGVEIFF